MGSGDGRLNFHAIDPSYGVKKSVGIDIDPTLIHQSKQRILKRHPAPTNIEFICADLMDTNSIESIELWKTIKSECTVMTMYFVEDALQKIKPLIERNLLGSKCKVVTIGYAMKGWEPQWAEVILGLTVHMYDMNNLDELFNRTENFDVSVMDEELNMLSKQKVADMEAEEGDNPFGEKLPPPSTVENDEDEDADFHWDFDENEDHDDENHMASPTTNQKKI